MTAPTSQRVGLRFTGIDIPQGAIITSAYLQFTADEVGSAATSLLIRGEDTDDAAAFASIANNVSSRATTDASAAWTPAAWTTVGQAGLAQRTSDLSAIVQEIVARSGWLSGNDMAFIVTGTGTRTAEPFEGGAAKAPLLHIEYTLPGTTVSVADGAPNPQREGATARIGFTIALSAPATDNVLLAYSTVNGTAAAGSDFVGVVNGQAAIAAGSTSATVFVNLINDSVFENPEAFTLRLDSARLAASGAALTITNATGTGNIADDEVPPPTVAIANGTPNPQLEGAGAQIGFTITLSAPATEDVLLTYSTVDDTATAGSDFVRVINGPALIVAGSTSTTVSIDLLDDSAAESGERFGLVVNSARLATSGTDVPMAQQFVFQPGTDGADLWITDTFSYNDNYGVDDHQLKVGGWADNYNALLRFNFTNAPLPAQVGSATLRLYSSNPDPSGGYTATGMLVDELHTAWTESYGWHDYGLSYTNIGTTAAPGLGWFEIDVTSAVNRWLADPASNFGLRLRPLGIDQKLNLFISSDATGSMAQFRPQLVLDPRTGTGNIVDDEVPPTVTVADGTPSPAIEGSTAQISFTIALSAPAAEDVLLTYRTIAESDEADGGDIAWVDNGQARIAAGSTSTTISIDVLDDLRIEPSNPFELQLISAQLATSGALLTITDAGGVGWIRDNDPVPSIAVADGVASPAIEGAAARIGFIIMLSSPLDQDVSFSYRTENGTAIAGSDFVGVAERGATIAAGTTSTTVFIDLLNDAIAEDAEAFTLRLLGEEIYISTEKEPAVPIGIADATATGSIVDDGDVGPPPPQTVAVTDGAPDPAIEGAAVPISFTIALSAPAAEDVLVTYSTVDGTATAGSDFVGVVKGEATIAAGSTSTSVSIDLLNNNASETAEAFTLRLDSARLATTGPTLAITDAIGTGNIADDEVPPTAAVTDGAPNPQREGATAHVSFMIALSAPAAEDVILTYSTVNGTAAAGSDFVRVVNGQVTIVAGSTSTTVLIDVLNDSVVENPEAFTLRLDSARLAASGTALAIIDTEGTGSIADDDSAPHTFEKRVVSGADDVEQGPSGSMALTSSDLELVNDGSTNQRVGLRFTDIDIPQGAIITSAYLQFRSDEVGSAAASLLIRGEDSDDAAAFVSTANNVSLRATTDAFAAWAPAAWSTVGQAGLPQRTSDLSAVVQEIVGRSGWLAGNDMAFVITGTGTRTADAFEDGAAFAPLLHVEYTDYFVV